MNRRDAPLAGVTTLLIIVRLASVAGGFCTYGVLVDTEDATGTCRSPT